MTITEPDPNPCRWHCRRLLVVAAAIVAVAWGMLEWIRHRAEHRDVPVFVILPGPPPGLTARFPGIAKNEWKAWVHQVPYAEALHPRVSLEDLTAIRRCLAREKFFPFFPSAIEIRSEDVTALYEMRTNRRTGRVRGTSVTLTNQGSLWRIERVQQTTGIACFIRPPTLWDKFLSYLPFTD